MEQNRAKHEEVVMTKLDENCQPITAATDKKGAKENVGKAYQQQWRDSSAEDQSEETAMLPKAEQMVLTWQGT